MTVHLLDVVPRDVRADALGLVLDVPAPAALAELTLSDGRGGSLTLGVLGASHVVTASVPGAVLTEQVSCDAVAAGGTRLPRSARSGAHRLMSETREVPRAELEAQARRLHELAETDPAWLCGAFPGGDGAVTALTAAALPGGGWRWESWHLYPGEEHGVVVTTSSRWTP
ncbi:DUF2617 family protein [Geodermatophilus sp. SYSU D00815]